MAELFDKDSDTIGLHLRNIYQSGELEKSATTGESSVVRREGSRQVNRKLNFYNLDAVISVGYRVNSKKGARFRMWATQRLKEYLVKGYSINLQRFEQNAEELGHRPDSKSGTLFLHGNGYEARAGGYSQPLYPDLFLVAAV